MPKERETKILQAQAIDLLHTGRFSETKGRLFIVFLCLLTWAKPHSALILTRRGFNHQKAQKMCTVFFCDLTD